MTNEIDIRRGATSASNAQADTLCPGRHLAQKGIPETPPGPDAEFGRIIHSALAVGSEEGKHTVDLMKMTGEQRDIFDACREIEKEGIRQYFGNSPTPENQAQQFIPKRVFREQRYWCMVDNKFEHSGQPDVIVRAGPKAIIFEYKTLAGDVPESPTNLQLRDQVVLTAGSLLLKEIAVAVIQPLVTHEPTLTLYNEAAIKQAETEMWDRVRKSNDPASLRVAGEVQCKYCRARGVCKEYQKWAGSLLPVPASIVDLPMADWTPDQCALFASGRAAAQKWLDEAEAMLKARLTANPEAVPGWCLKEGIYRETITDPQELFNRFGTLGGTLEQFLACIAVTKGKFEEQVRGIAKLKGKALKSKVEELLQDITESKQNAPSLAKKKE